VVTTLEQTFRDEWGRVLAVLVGFLGDFALAEEATQEAFAVAAERWPREGAPSHPRAWLVTTARHRAIDHLRRDRVLAQKLRLLDLPGPVEDPVDETTIPDERLELLFTCCHPALALDAQVALTLRTLGGLSTEQIAHAFLVPEATMAKRLGRAKHKLRAARIPFRVPPSHGGARLAARGGAAGLAAARRALRRARAPHRLAGRGAQSRRRGRRGGRRRGGARAARRTRTARLPLPAGSAGGAAAAARPQRRCARRLRARARARAFRGGAAPARTATGRAGRMRRMASVRLRRAKQADVPRLAAVARAAYERYVPRMGRPPRPMVESYDDVVARHEVTVAERDGEVIGLVVLVPDDADGFLLDNIAVDPAHHGTGVGRALLEHAEREARRAGFDSLYLFTHELMTENQALYARVGYVEFARRQHGDALLVYMRKPLT
jgi:RNA polymerase sigma factor (sigma-70 family)